MLTDLLVAFYRFWHGKLQLKGAGVLLRASAQVLPALGHYQLSVPNLGVLTINLKDSSGIGWLNYSLGEGGNEVGMISAIIKLAPPNPVIWDVGANAGYFIAAVIDELKRYREIRLFEPNPKLDSILREFAGLLPNIHTHNLALSDKVETIALHIPRKDSSTASFTPVTTDSSPVKVKCTTGDVFLKESGALDPDLVIIDTEGNDCRVIQGFAELIHRKRPVIFFENIFETEATINAALPPTYRCLTVNDISGELTPGLDKTRGHNCVFVPQN